MESFWNEAKIIALIILILCFAAIIYIGVSVYGELQCIDFNKPLYQHIHIQVKGIDIPKGIGLEPNCFREIHTHANSGVLHIESNAPKNFTLNDFFELWGRNSTGLVPVINGQWQDFDTNLKDGDRIIIRH